MSFYLPHHPAIGAKLRVVFDGSFQDRDRRSLNDALHIGPCIQRNLFKLTTVTYGTACAPFLAVRVLEQLAADHEYEFPRAARILLDDVYVDDVLTGAMNEQELLDIKEELVLLMSRVLVAIG
ncbi:uncharacterized protein [Drosophila tropicalis]|uniref:uncharacterized protein n=1 Tax=Drosophila tropicalis TaxID=46794 RepID=UPI0035AC1267